MPPKKQKEKKKGKGPAEVEAAPAEEVAMTDADLKLMSVPPERPAGASDVEFPFPGGQGYHAYRCGPHLAWLSACHPHAEIGTQSCVATLRYFLIFEW